MQVTSLVQTSDMQFVARRYSQPVLAQGAVTQWLALYSNVEPADVTLVPGCTPLFLSEHIHCLYYTLNSVDARASLGGK